MALAREQGIATYAFQGQGRTVADRRSPVIGWWYAFGILRQPPVDTSRWIWPENGASGPCGKTNRVVGMLQCKARPESHLQPPPEPPILYVSSPFGTHDADDDLKLPRYRKFMGTLAGEWRVS